MSKASFLEAIDQRVLVCDGAMGTMLYGKGIFLNRCFDELNLTQPDLVAEVHQGRRLRMPGRLAGTRGTKPREGSTDEGTKGRVGYTSRTIVCGRRDAVPERTQTGVSAIACYPRES